MICPSTLSIKFGVFSDVEMEQGIRSSFGEDEDNLSNVSKQTKCRHLDVESESDSDCDSDISDDRSDGSRSDIVRLIQKVRMLQTCVVTMTLMNSGLTHYRQSIKMTGNFAGTGSVC